MSDTKKEDLFLLSEIYHENSKMRVIDREFYSWINHVNTSPTIRNMISRPNYNYNGYTAFKLHSDLEVEDEKKFLYNLFLKRRSTRSFADVPIDLNCLSRLLFLADGVTASVKENDGSEWRMRTAPSPGALFPIEIYCIVQNVTGIPTGVYLFSPIQNEIIAVDPQSREALYKKMIKAMNPMKETLVNSPVVFVLAANMARISFKYKERAYRFALLETGHIAQNILIAAESENLGAICVGGYIDDALNELINADGLDTIVHYCIPIGQKIT